MPGAQADVPHGPGPVQEIWSAAKSPVERLEERVVEAGKVTAGDRK